MKSYEDYELEDLVQDTHFRKWALSPEKTDNTFWNVWLKEHPHKKPIVEQAVEIIQAFQCDAGYNSPESDRQSIEEILSRVHSISDRSWWKNGMWKAAACFILVSVAGWWLLGNRNLPIAEMAHPIEKASIKEVYTNHERIARLIQLGDGSEVRLEAGSTLRIDQGFGIDKREVYLEGEAEFSVQRNVNLPFMVYTEGLVTRVLGTKFRINTLQADQKISVSVSSGKVTVYKDNLVPDTQLSEELILTTNQQAIFIKTEQKIVKTLVDSPLPVGHDAVESFVYREAPMNTVLKDLERVYGVTMLYDEQLLKKCNLTATLSTEPLYDKLSLICETIHARYKVVDGQIVINAVGCE